MLATSWPSSCNGGGALGIAASVEETAARPFGVCSTTLAGGSLEALNRWQNHRACTIGGLAAKHDAATDGANHA